MISDRATLSLLIGFSIARSAIGANATQELNAAVEVARASIESQELPFVSVFDSAPFDVSADGRTLVYALAEKSTASNAIVTDVWIQDLRSAARPIQLTAFSPSGAVAALKPRLSPNGSSVAFVSAVDRGCITIIDVRTRSMRRLRPIFEGTVVFVPRSVVHAEWAPDGRALAVTLTEEPAHIRLDQGVSVRDDWWRSEGLEPVPLKRLAVVDASDGRVLALTSGSVSVSEFEWSPDSTRIVFSGAAPEVPVGAVVGEMYHTDLYLFDVRSGRERRLVKRPGRDLNPGWSPDGSRIAFRSTENGDAYAPGVLGVVDVATGSTRYFGAPAGVPVWLDDKRLAFSAPAKMGCPISVVVAATGDRRQGSPDDLSCVAAIAVARRAGKMFFVRQSYMRADEILETSLTSWRPTQVSNFSEGLRLPSNDMRAVSWSRADGKGPIHGILITPNDGYVGRRPLIVLIYGGPSMVAPGAFNVNAQQLAHPLISRGYAVLVPNTRGRGGYDRADADAIRANGDYLPGPYTDVMGGVDLVVKTLGIADGDRIGVMGFSYGANLVAYSIAQTNRFRAAVSGDPTAVDFIHKGLMQTPTGEMIELNLMGFGSVYDESQRALREKNSTVNFSANVRTPTLLQCGIDGGAIEACPKLAYAYRYFSVPFDYVVYPRTGHGLTEPSLRLDSARRELAWLEYWVLGTPVPELTVRFGPPKVSAWIGP